MELKNGTDGRARDDELLKHKFRYEQFAFVSKDNI